MFNIENTLPNSFRAYFKNLCLKLLGVFFIALSIFLFLSIITYHFTDTSINTAGNFTTQNFGGFIGATIANIFLYFFGLTSLVFIYNIFLVGKYFIFPQKIFHPIKNILLYMTVSIIPTSLSLSYISNIFLKNFPTRSGLGGFLGLIIKTDINTLLDTLYISRYMNIILFIISTLISCITLYFALDLTTKSILKFENFIRLILSKIKNIILKLFKKEAKPVKIKPQKSKILSIAKKITPKKQPAKPSVATNVSKPKVVKETIPEKPKYILPTVDLLTKVKPEKSENLNDESNIKKARMLENILREYKLEGKITNIKAGPVITLFEMEPGPGIKTSQIKSLNEDIARKIESISTRIAVIPGTNKVGIELPNLHRKMVSLRDQFESDTFKNSEHKLPISLGADTGGHPVFVDLATMPHLLIAGTTGSGKSVGVNGMILSLLYKYTPDECKFIMIDPKMVEFSIYNDIPHLLIPVVTEPAKAVAALKWAVVEMEERYRNMAAIGAKNIETFNARAKSHPNYSITRQVQTGFDPQTGEPIMEDKKIDIKPIPYIVIVVDEMADLMQTAKKEVEGAVARLAAMARATGIHLILSTQRPSVDVITGTIKSNFPNRISYRVASGQDSRTILNEYGAELMLGKGDMLYMATGGNTVRIHGAFVSEKEIETVVNFIKAQAKPNYVRNITVEKKEPNKLSTLDKMALKESQNADLYAQAVEIVLSSERPSISYLQRQLGIGYNKSANLIEKMEAQGILSKPDSTGKRVILTKRD
ncbi:MAG: DNA translocase FtsK 4TM domain-containing protein [Alphaproteobacteria bacterium]|nr:DNA translocase FtsK 4TM domain-containing protein [Alphaproteobacteria bacterium]